MSSTFRAVYDAKPPVIDEPTPCLTDPERWYADRNNGKTGGLSVEQREAIAACKTCPQRAVCLEAALANREQYGIWAGLLPDERKALLRRRAS